MTHEKVSRRSFLSGIGVLSTIGIAGCSSTDGEDSDFVTVELFVVEMEAEPDFSEFLADSYVDDGPERLLGGSFVSDSLKNLYVQQLQAQNDQYEFAEDPESALYEDGWYPMAKGLTSEEHSQSEDAVHGLFYDIEFGTEHIPRSYEYVRGGYSIQDFSLTDRVRVVEYSQISESLTVHVEETIEDLVG
jgi:hypothetical protein